jgi:hypothetical protein
VVKLSPGLVFPHLETTALFLFVGKIAVLLEELHLFDQVGHPLLQMLILLPHLQEGDLNLPCNKLDLLDPTIFLLF